MKYQKCPICNGTGIKPIEGLAESGHGWSSGAQPACPVCKGARIINEITGKPPKPKETKLDIEEVKKLWQWRWR